MTRPVLFLDIDGVLNGHDYEPKAKSNKIRPSCVEVLNAIIAATDCAIVISSAWRYMVIMGEMTVRAFEYLLRSHGVHAIDRVIGVTEADGESLQLLERVKQIKRYVEAHEVEHYVVVDDLDLSHPGFPFYQTEGTVGLTPEDGVALIRLLTTEIK